MSERTFRCEICGSKYTGTCQPYKCEICGGTTFHYLSSQGTLHKTEWK